MRGDFTRDTRERARRASTRAVLLQQGRQLLDADWNEQAGLTADREEELARHVIGRQGAPRDDAGFAISNGTDFAIGAGSIYAQGLHVRNNTPTTYSAQSPIAGLLPNLDTILPDNSEGLVYMEALLRPASLTSDPNLAEPALAGADTVVRETVAWSVRVAPLAGIGMARGPLISALDTNQPVTIIPWQGTTGGLDADVQTEAEATDPTPCEMPPTAGYLDQLNRLYRIEIHMGGAPGIATFKWTEDPSAEAGLRAQGAGFAIDLPIARASELFATGTVVELIDDVRMGLGLVGPIGAITSAPGDALTINGVPAASLTASVRVRRWATMPVVVPASSNWVTLSKGIKVRFASGAYETGSAWTIAGRTLIGDILWPPYPVADMVEVVATVNVGFYRPTEGRRRHAALALIRRSGANYVVTEDLRDLFPPLTDITASDVRYDNSSSNLGATTVQEAIDALAARDSLCCTYEVQPGTGWWGIFTTIPSNAHATICFGPGNYDLPTAAIIAGLGHVRLKGAGQGTKIWCYGDESALRFNNCKSVEIADMMIVAERRSAPSKLGRTAGAVDITDCGSVRIERATLIGAGTRWRQSACLRVDATRAKAGPGAGTVTVENCDIVAGDLASGIIVLNGDIVSISGNRFRVRSETVGRTLKRWGDDRKMAATMGRLLYSYAGWNAERDAPIRRLDDRLFSRSSSMYGNAGNLTHFASTLVSKADWALFHRANAGAAGNSTMPIIATDIRKMVGNLWANSGVPLIGGVAFRGFESVYQMVNDTIAPAIDTAIVIAGNAAADISIRGNTIEGTFTGIRVGLSTAAVGKRIRAETVRIGANTIRLRAGPTDIVRNGIVVGNVNRLWLVDNDIASEDASSGNENKRLQLVSKLRLGKLHAEGVRVFGSLGNMVQVRGNTVNGCAIGFSHTASTGTDESAKQWLYHGNHAQNFRYAYRLDGRCSSVDNVG
jgi:hypothetical protein